MASKACCKVAPAVVKDYALKGAYSDFDDMKTYVVGDESSKTGAIILYDIFGFAPQILQGADIIAAGGNHLVIMPDFFRGPPVTPGVVPPDTDEKLAILTTFLQGQANQKTGIENLHKVLSLAKTRYPSVEKWAAIGYCWGAKVATLASGPGTPFTISISLHPAFIDPEDTRKVTIPQLVLASQGEPADQIAQMTVFLKNHVDENVRTKSHIETYDAVHGWMAARADFEKEDHVREYNRGYKQVVNYLKDHLTAAL